MKITRAPEMIIAIPPRLRRTPDSRSCQPRARNTAGLRNPAAAMSKAPKNVRAMPCHVYQSVF